MTPNIHFENREIEGERLEFPKHAIYWLGPNVTLRRCTLVLSVATRWLHLLSGQLVDCTRLDACRFYNCDMRTIQLPRWPCFTLLDPVRRAAELARVEWPGRFGSVVIEGLAKQEESIVALTEHAPSVAAQLGTTTEDLRAVLERLSGVVM